MPIECLRHEIWGDNYSDVMQNFIAKYFGIDVIGICEFSSKPTHRPAKRRENL